MSKLRLSMPYGIFYCEDGTEVLFNRNYSPIWSKDPQGKITSANPDKWIHHVIRQEYYFKDRNAPWRTSTTVKMCNAILSSWGIGPDQMPEAYLQFKAKQRDAYQGARQL